MISRCRSATRRCSAVGSSRVMNQPRIAFVPLLARSRRIRLESLRTSPSAFTRLREVVASTTWRQSSVSNTPSVSRRSTMAAPSYSAVGHSSRAMRRTSFSNCSFSDRVASSKGTSPVGNYRLGRAGRITCGRASRRGGGWQSVGCCQERRMADRDIRRRPIRLGAGRCHDGVATVGGVERIQDRVARLRGAVALQLLDLADPDRQAGEFGRVGVGPDALDVWPARSPGTSGGSRAPRPGTGPGAPGPSALEGGDTGRCPNATPGTLQGPTPGRALGPGAAGKRGGRLPLVSRRHPVLVESLFLEFRELVPCVMLNSSASSCLYCPLTRTSGNILIMWALHHGSSSLPAFCPSFQPGLQQTAAAACSAFFCRNSM